MGYSEAYPHCWDLARWSMCLKVWSATRGMTGPGILSSGGKEAEEYSSKLIQHRNAKTTWKTTKKQAGFTNSCLAAIPLLVSIP